MDAGGDDERSDLRIGLLLAWGVAIGASIVAALLGAILDGVGTGSIGFVAGVLPPLALLGLLAGCWFGGHRRIALGVLAGFGTMFAVALLGVAACFGLIGLGGM